MKKFIQVLFLYISVTFSVQAAKPGDSAPKCKLKHFKTQEILNILDFKGKVVYLDFWASWCPTCKKSFPFLNQLHNELNIKGFEIFAVNLDEEKEDADAFLHNNPVDFAIAYDAKGKCPNAYQVMAMPASYLIDKQGIVREIHMGFKDEDVSKIRTKVLALLDE